MADGSIVRTVPPARGLARAGGLPSTARRVFAVLIGCVAGLAPFQGAAQDFDGVVVETTPLRNGLHMMEGAGGNLLVSAGEDGVLVVDDQYAPLAPKIRDAIAKLGRGPVRWVVNTHWHTDHTGGNEAMAEAGAVIVAHDNVRERMSTEQFMAAFGRRVPPSPEAALPIVTFDRSVSLHLNGDQVRVVHTPSAHTDGDAMVRFRSANVVHSGDVFFNGMYPFFDASSGGAFVGMIDGANRLLELVDDDSLIVPGHGPLAKRSDIVAYRDMLVEVRSLVSAAMRAGRTRAEIVASRPTRGLDPRFGNGFLKPDSFVALVYESLKREPGARSNAAGD